MSKAEFLKRLETGLAGASPEERVAALQYFTEYLDEAGPEREAEVLAELGSPEKVASDVLSVAGGEAGEAPQGGKLALLSPAAPQAPAAGAEPTPPWLAAVTNVFSSLGQPPKPGGNNIYPRAESSPPPMAPMPPAVPPPQAGSYSADNTRVAKIILIVLACIFLAPIIGALASALLALLAAAVVLFLCPVIIGVSLVLASVFSVVMGIILMPTGVPNGLVVLGSAICLLGLGLLCLYGGIRLLGTLLPKLVRSVIGLIGRLWQKIFPRAGKTTEV